MTITSAHGKKGQRWALKRTGQFYQFINVETGRAMELNSGQRIKGTALTAATPGQSRDQLFCIQKPYDPKYCGKNGSPQSRKSKGRPENIFEGESNFQRNR